MSEKASFLRKTTLLKLKGSVIQYDPTSSLVCWWEVELSRL
jgi:hypothetical protein